MSKNKTIKVLLLFLALQLFLTACGQAAEAENTAGPAGETVTDATIAERAAEIAAETEAETERGTETEIETETETEEETAMLIRVEGNGNTILFELNDSQAARDLYEQLPLTIEVEDYSTNEKIFYPPQELDTSDAPRAGSGAGTLAYYAPWGDVVMFYGDFGEGGGVYELGQAVSGSEYISELTGTIQVEQE